MKTKLNNESVCLDYFDNYLNGNLRDFKKQISGLSKIEIFRFIQWLQGYTTKANEIINYLAEQDSLTD